MITIANCIAHSPFDPGTYAQEYILS
jgi:hypothetical protein